MKRIAVILPSFAIGGTEHMVANLAKYINKQKYKLMVISLMNPTNTHIQKMIEESKVDILYAGKGSVPVWRVFTKIYSELVKFRPDLIHSNMYAFVYVVPYLLTHNVKLLHTIHNKPQNEFFDKYKKLIGLLYRMNKAVPVAISHIVEKEMMEIYPYIKRIECVYNPVEIDKFYIDPDRRKNEKIVYIFVARFMKQKNHALLLESFSKALEKVKNIKLMLVGDGELRQDIEQQAAALGITKDVEFIGNVSNVNDYLAKANVFVMSSAYEGLPLSILEAMAAGLPIISTNVGGIADIVTNNGILTENGNSEELSDAIVKLAKDSELRNKLGKNSLENARQYDSHNFILQYQKLYDEYAN